MTNFNEWNVEGLKKYSLDPPTDSANQYRMSLLFDGLVEVLAVECDRCYSVSSAVACKVSLFQVARSMILPLG